jgi:predicted flap endonuclease-1-like 5' DNA nuclease
MATEVDNSISVDEWISRQPGAVTSAVESAGQHDDGDLPSIGGPARRALHHRGITTLDQVAQMTEREMLAMHGVGPKAVGILRETLAERGRTLVSPRTETPQRAADPSSSS